MVRLNPNHWDEAYQWMKHGGGMPDHLKKLLVKPPKIVLPHQQDPTPPRVRPLMDRADVDRLYFGVPPNNLLDEMEDFKFKGLRDFITSPDPVKPDATSAPDLDIIDRLPNFDPGGGSTTFQGGDTTKQADPRLKGTYVDPDGTQHDTEELVDRPEGEMCSTCGAYWRCDCP